MRFFSMDGVVVVNSHKDFTASSERRAAVDEYLLLLRWWIESTMPSAQFPSANRRGRGPNNVANIWLGLESAFFLLSFFL